MFAQMITLDVAPGRSAEFLDALGDNARGTRTEPGFVRFDLLRSQETDNRYILYEVFRDEAALEAHRGTEHYKRCMARFGELLAAPPSRVILTPEIVE